MSTVRGIPWLESVDAKLDRAHVHLQAISRDLDSFVRETKQQFIPKVNLGTNEASLVWYAEEPTHPDMSISVEIGEFLYLVRSSLDNLICGLVRATLREWRSCSGNAFPIHTHGERFEEDAPRALKNIPAEARTLVQGLQPYVRGVNGAALDPLNILNQLRNRDTHRALNLGLFYQRNTELLVSDVATGRVLAHAHLPQSVYLSTAPQVIPLPITAAEMPAMVNVKAGATRGTRFREEGPWEDRNVVDVLTNCLVYVEERVVDRFKPFFDSAAEFPR